MTLRLRIRGSIAGTLSLVLLGPSAGGAQVPVTAGANPIQAGASATFERYSFDDPLAANVETLSLQTTSFAVRVPLVGPTRLGIAARYARGALVRAGGAKSTLDGMTDTELTLSIPLRRGNLVTTATGIVLLPTGNSSLSEEEAALAGIVASELLPFRISYWGGGGSAGGSIGTVYGNAGGSLGLSAGYLIGRSFEPLRGHPFVYQPGNQFQLRAAVDRVLGGTGKLTLSASLLNSDADRGDEANLYQTGNRYQATGSYSFALGQRASAILYLGGVHRNQGEALQEISRGMPAHNLILAGAGMRVPLGGGVLLPTVDARVFRRASGEDQGYVTGLGLAWEQAAGGVLLVPSLRGRFGRLVVTEGSESGLTGLDVGLAIRSARSRGR